MHTLSVYIFQVGVNHCMAKHAQLFIQNVGFASWCHCKISSR